MYSNVLAPVQNLRKTTRIKPGGICRIIFFKWEDVLVWPPVSPTLYTIEDDLTLKEGAAYYLVEPAAAEKFFTEEQKDSPQGPYYEVLVNGKIGGHTLNHIASTDAMKYHQYGLLITDINGETRLIGSPDCGASFTASYTSGDGRSSRSTSIAFKWESENRLPIYQGLGIIVDDELIPIGSGGTVIGSGLNEVLQFANVGSADVSWTAQRQTRFGDMPVFNVWLKDEFGILRRVENIEISGGPEATDVYHFDFGGVTAKAYIIIS